MNPKSVNLIGNGVVMEILIKVFYLSTITGAQFLLDFLHQINLGL